MRVKRASLVAAALLTVLAVWLGYGRPFTLITLRSGPMPADSFWMIKNPFRPRGPERAADAFLALVRAGRCDVFDSLRPPLDHAVAERICRREAENRLLSWRLESADWESHVAKLTYLYRRQGYDSENRLDVWVEERDNVWVVKDYTSVY